MEGSESGVEGRRREGERDGEREGGGEEGAGGVVSRCRYFVISIFRHFDISTFRYFDISNIYLSSIYSEYMSGLFKFECGCFQLLSCGLMSEICPSSAVFDTYLLKNDTYFIRLMRRNVYLCRGNHY